MESDHVVLTRFFQQVLPPIVSEHILDSLLQIKDLKFWGPSVLFAFLGAGTFVHDIHHSPTIHIQCPKDKHAVVRALFGKHLKMANIKDRYMVHETPCDSFFVFQKSHVFLFDEQTIATVVDIYNITFDAIDGFQGTPQQDANILAKTCRFNARIMQLLLPTATEFEHFLEFDCSVLHALDFKLDWNSQLLWSHVWLTILEEKDKSWLDVVENWNAKTSLQTLNRRPMLAVTTKKPFLKHDVSMIGNSLFGIAILTNHLLGAKHVGALPFLEWNVVDLVPVVTTQIGEYFSADIRQHTFVVYQDKKIALPDLFLNKKKLSLAVHVKPADRSTCRVFSRLESVDLSTFLQKNTDSIAVFVANETRPQRKQIQAFCYEWSQISKRRVYVCDFGKNNKPFAHTHKSYWELSLVNLQKRNVVITQENWNQLERRTTRYFMLVELRSDVVFTDAVTFDRTKIASCDAALSISSLTPIVLSADINKTPELAIAKIFQEYSKHLPPLSKQLIERDDDETETETADSDIEDSEQEEREFRKQQHNPGNI